MTPTRPHSATPAHLLHERYGDPSTDLQASKVAALQEWQPRSGCRSRRTPRPHVPEGSPRSWVDEAACAGRPGVADHTDGPNVSIALQLCAQCPVVEQCAQWVQGESEFTGVAAGRVIYSRRKKENAA